MNNSRPIDTPPQPASSGVLGHLFRGWFLLYLIPGLAIFLIKDHRARQEEAKQEQARQREVQEMLRKTPPAEMSPALKALYGIEAKNGATPAELNGKSPNVIGDQNAEKPTDVDNP